MILRSGRIINEFPIIDFDFASQCWRLNKKKKRGCECWFTYT